MSGKSLTCKKYNDMRGTNRDKAIPSTPVRSREPHMGALTHRGLQPNHHDQLPDLTELWRINSRLLPGGSRSGVEGQETVAVRWWFW